MAIQAYDRCRAVLADLLDAAPSAETLKLLNEIRGPSGSRIPSRPSRIQVTRTASEASSALQAIDPRKAVESLSRQYDQAGIDPGRGFAEVAKRAAAGDAPGELKEAVQAARTETR